MDIDIAEMEAIYGRVSSLLPAQQRVANALGDGCFEIDKIAKRLDIQPGTVATTLHTIYNTINVYNIVQLGGAMYWKQLSKNPKRRRPPEIPLAELLTPEELRIAALIAEGYENLNISAIIDISEGITKYKIGTVLRKLKLTHRIELAFRVLREHFHTLQHPQSPAPS